MRRADHLSSMYGRPANVVTFLEDMLSDRLGPRPDLRKDRGRDRSGRPDPRKGSSLFSRNRSPQIAER